MTSDLLSRRRALLYFGLSPLLCGLSIPSAFAEQSPDIYYDSDGLIVHKGMDGGDTAQREGWYWVGVWIRQNVLGNPWPISRSLAFSDVLALLEPHQDGIFYRHPKLAPWNNPFDKKFGFSRDQMIPLVAAMGLWNQSAALRRLWNALPQDVVGGTKHTFNGEWITVFGQRTVFTGDVVTPSTINLFRRAWNEDPAQASDGNGPGGERELAADSALKIPPFLSDRDSTGDDLNLIVMLLMSVLRYPFPGAPQIPSTAQQLAGYAKNRLISYGSFLAAYRGAYGQDLDAIEFTQQARQNVDSGIASGWQTDASRVYGAIRWYHRRATGANPKLAELYEPIVRQYLE